MLYNRRTDKIQPILKNKGFEGVLPKYKNYYKILNSEYFDEDWYRNEYDIPDNTDAVVHFLLVGFKKGYNPGPNFNINEYLRCNLDIYRDNLNPLVHYETHGIKENRPIHVSELYSRDYSLISDSPYFDEDWYKRTYDIHDEDCVDHYLKTGYLKLYNPGPDFNTFQYLECNMDLKRIQINPLVHYELVGRKENRKINFDDERCNKYRSAIADSPYFDEDWYNSTYDIQDMDCADHYLNIGFAKGYNPGPDFSTDKYYEYYRDVKQVGLNPLVHYELYGKYEGRKLKLPDEDIEDV